MQIPVMLSINAASSFKKLKEIKKIFKKKVKLMLSSFQNCTILFQRIRKIYFASNKCVFRSRSHLIFLHQHFLSVFLQNAVKCTKESFNIDEFVVVRKI